MTKHIVSNWKDFQVVCSISFRPVGHLLLLHLLDLVRLNMDFTADLVMKAEGYR